MKRLPIVAIIGQTNAGKSSLLNRFARQNIAITAREEGTTRDNVIANIENKFLMIDTAGLKDPEDSFEENIQDQINDAIDTADLIMLVLDSTKFPDDKDIKIARSALKSQKPLLLLLNKSDLGDSLPEYEFYQLGIDPDYTLKTSATTGFGTNSVRTFIEKTLNIKNSATPQAESIKISLIGRPNVGKSSLFNALAKKQQAIVSSRQGTTRDINRTTIKFQGKQLEFLDTAGLRKPGKREVGIEKFSALRTLAAIEESDICAMLIDSTDYHSKLDQALAGQIVKSGKSIIFVLTKTDLITENVEEKINEIINKIEYDFNFIPYAPVIITSSVTGKNVTQIFSLIETIIEQKSKVIKTTDLNRILADAVISHPPAGLKNTHPKPKYIVQTDSNPPWFVVHGHELQLLHWSYKRFLERKIREFHPFIGTPIFFSFKNDGAPHSSSKDKRR